MALFLFQRHLAVWQQLWQLQNEQMKANQCTTSLPLLQTNYPWFSIWPVQCSCFVKQKSLRQIAQSNDHLEILGLMKWQHGQSLTKQIVPFGWFFSVEFLWKGNQGEFLNVQSLWEIKWALRTSVFKSSSKNLWKILIVRATCNKHSLFVVRLSNSFSGTHHWEFWFQGTFCKDGDVALCNDHHISHQKWQQRKFLDPQCCSWHMVRPDWFGLSRKASVLVFFGFCGWCALRCATKGTEFPWEKWLHRPLLGVPRMVGEGVKRNKYHTAAWSSHREVSSFPPSPWSVLIRPCECSYESLTVPNDREPLYSKDMNERGKRYSRSFPRTSCTQKTKGNTYLRKTGKPAHAMTGSVFDNADS